MIEPAILYKGLFRKMALLTVATLCYAVLLPAQQQVSNPVFPNDYRVIHPQFRKWPSPSMGSEALSVSPTLYWPANKKANGYDIRLSQDPAFAGNQTISGQDIPWTIYTPHRALNKGTWYWQYRVHESKWSEIQTFQISDKANKNFAPTVDQFWSSIPATHPRVLIDKKNETGFPRQVSGTDDAKAILKDVEEWMNVSPPSEEEGKSKMQGANETENNKMALVASEKASNKMYYAIELFCKAFIITRDKQYADKGILWAMSVAGWDPEGVSVLNDFGDARCMVGMALAFDTFHDRLTETQRATLVKAIHARADRFYHDWINNIDAKVLSNHVWQYILHYFFQTAIAVYGETPDARHWIQYAYELWLARAPVLGGNDGGWCEGASYFRLNMETLLDIPVIIKQYTGYDFIANTEWYRLNPYWMLYSFPPGSSADGFGDDIEKLYSPGYDYLAYADALSKITGSQVAAWYAGQIEKTENIKLGDAAKMRWFRMRYLQKEKRPAAIQPSLLAPAMAFRGTGIADMHSNIADRNRNVMISFRSSPYGSYGHLLGDQNTFNVLVGGDRLFYMSGHKVAMQDPHRLGWYKATQGHNGILIDDKGQPFNVEAYGYLPRFIDGKNISYLVGDASQAYSSEAEKQQAGLTKFRRHLLFLHPDILLIYDELEADHPAKWSWLIHSSYKITIHSAQNQFNCQAKKGSASASLFATQPLHWELSDTFAIAAVNWLGREDEEGNLIEYKNDQWHLAASSTVKSNKMRFLAVLRINQKGEIEKEPLPYQFNDKGEIVINKWVIKAELDATKPSLLEVYNADKRTAFTSAADKIKLDNKEFTGKTGGSSKLVEWTGEKYSYTETGDIMPDAVKEIPLKK